MIQNLTWPDFAVLIAYLGMVLFLGFRGSGRRLPGAEDYILAGRSLALPAFVATLVTSFYGGTLGIGESSFTHGLSNWLIQGVPYYVFAALYACFLAPRIRREPGLTLPDHLERVYGVPTAVLAAVLVFILASPADEILMLSLLTRWVTGWTMPLCAIVVTALSIAFLFKGGLRAGVWSAGLEFLIMFGGFFLILPFAFAHAGGIDFLSLHLPASHLTPTGERSAAYLLSWFFIAVWTFVDPGFHQRVCAAKDASTARRGIAVAIAFWALFDFMTTTAGLYARALLPDLGEPLAAYPALASLLLPPAVRGLFLAGVASSTLAALSANSFLSAISLAKDAAGRLLRPQAAAQERWIRWGLLASSALAVAGALAIPSVVRLWFVVGSVMIPGLLVVTVSSYFDGLRISAPFAFCCALAGWLFSAAAWALAFPTPFYPGLAASLGVWALGRLVRNLGPRAG